jgi:energy-coupling factor transporter ATP-binding protein EcfA2
MTQHNQALAVSASGLRKSFGEKTVLDGLDLAIPQGTIFALLGPNGAGKTTTVQILSTLIPADAGEVRVAGHDVRTEADRVRAAIGVTGGRPGRHGPAAIPDRDRAARVGAAGPALPREGPRQEPASAARGPPLTGPARLLIPWLPG